jgi:hypothetical protein
MGSNILLNGKTGLKLRFKTLATIAITFITITSLAMTIYFNIQSNLNSIRVENKILSKNISEIKFSLENSSKLNNLQMKVVENYVTKCLVSKKDIIEFKDDLNIIK